MHIITKQTTEADGDYLVYLMVGDTKVECYSEPTKKSKDKRVLELFRDNFKWVDTTSMDLDVTPHVTQLSFEQYQTQY